MGLSREEWETYISFGYDAEAVIYSSDPTWIRKLKKLCEEHPENYQVKEIGKVNGEEISIRVTCKDKGLVSLRGAKATLSEEERIRRTEILRAARINSEISSSQNSGAEKD